jgi:DNA topoisomerase I
VPHGVKLKYDGVPIDLTPAEEEVTSFFAAVIGTDYEKNQVFVKNFFTNFLEVVGKVCHLHCKSEDWNSED